MSTAHVRIDRPYKGDAAQKTMGLSGGTATVVYFDAIPVPAATWR